MIGRISSVILVCLLFIASLSAVEQVLATFDGKAQGAGGVHVQVALISEPGKAEAQLSISFDAISDMLNHYHLYAPDSPGLPLKISVSGVHQRGEWSTDAPTKIVPFDGVDYKVYKSNLIKVLFPISLPKEDSTVEMTLSYLACSDEQMCKMAVNGRKVTFELKGIGALGVQPEATSNNTADSKQSALSQELIEAHKQRASATGIAWQHPKTVKEVEAIIAAAHANGLTVYLDFTGPSCLNCQAMAKNILIIPEVRDAWNEGVPVEINTDYYTELGNWQLERFKTYTRPLYVRIDPDGTEVKWDTYFGPGDKDTFDKFMDFLKGGDGAQTGTGDNFLEFIGWALVGGLFTLLMPCTYPMIPLTVNFFTKQADAGRKLFPLAFAYAFGILASFTLLGVIVGVVLKTNIVVVAGSPWLNFIIGAMFILLGLSLIGVFFLRLPSGFAAKFGSGRMGYGGALLMGLTFAITAFTCTAPFAGSVLAQGALSGDLFRPALGMMIYASVIAIPFFFLAMSPKMLERLPKAGSWMNEFKVIGGIVEIAAAFKFLAISDFAWSWGIFGRTSCLGIWIILSLISTLYLIGVLRLPSDSKVASFGLVRCLFILFFGAAALYLTLGLFHVAPLGGIIEGFFPGDPAPM